MSEETVSDFVVGMIIGIFAGIIMGVGGTNHAWVLEATERHYGGYCRDSGDWHWNSDCEASK